MELTKAQQFCQEVRRLAEKYEIPFFVVTNGASAHSYPLGTNKSYGIMAAHLPFTEWEKKMGIDTDEGWSDKL